MKYYFFLLFILFLQNLQAQSTYSGTIGQYPIELITEIYSDGVADAVYNYSKFDHPVNLHGEWKNTILTFFEKDKSKKKVASLIFLNFDPKRPNSKRNLDGFKNQETIAYQLNQTI